MHGEGTDLTAFWNAFFAGVLNVSRPTAWQISEESSLAQVVRFFLILIEAVDDGGSVCHHPVESIKVNQGIGRELRVPCSHAHDYIRRHQETATVVFMRAHPVFV